MVTAVFDSAEIYHDVDQDGEHVNSKQAVGNAAGVPAYWSSLEKVTVTDDADAPTDFVPPFSIVVAIRPPIPSVYR